MTLVALIPARGGSKGIPRKNIRSFCGKPLLQWSIDVAQAAPSVDRVVVSTEDLEIAEIANSGGAEVPFLRPLGLASDTTSGIETVLHALGQLTDLSEVLLLQPTSPLRQVEDVEGIISMFRKLQAISIVSVTRSNKNPAWMYKLTEEQRLEALIPSANATRRQDLPPAYILNGAMYLASREFIEKEKKLISHNTLGFEMPQDRSIDIDTPLDWQWGEFLMSQKQS